MSQIRELIAVFRGVDQVTPVINEINGGLTNMGRVSEQTTGRMASQTGTLAREMDRFRRTFGYAVAGLATYQLFGAINNLRDFQQHLGAINALIPQAGTQVDALGRIAMRISTQTATPLNNVLESMQNIIQSIPGMSRQVRMHLVPAMAEIEAAGARVLGTDPRSFGTRVLGTATAFMGRQRLMTPQGPHLLQRVANQITTTAFTTPGVTGDELINYLPTLTQGAIAGRFTLDQALALFTVAQRTTGGRPAQTIQYLRQLFIRLRRPTPQAMPYFQQAGIGPQQITSMGGFPELMQLIRHGLSLPGGLNTPDVTQAIRRNQLGLISPTNQSANFFTQAFGGRIQSLIAVNAIVRGLGQVDPQIRRLQGNTQTLNSRLAAFNRRDPLTVMANSLSNATTDILYNFNPAISLLSQGAGGLGRELQRGTNLVARFSRTAGNEIGRVTGSHTAGRISGGLLETLGTAGALYGGYRLARGLGRFVGRRPTGALTPLDPILETRAASAALEGVARGTSTQPFWVVIHPLSEQTVPGLFSGGLVGPRSGAGGGTERQAEGWITRLGKKFGIPGAIGAAGARLGGLRTIGAGALDDIAAGTIGVGGAGIAAGLASVIAAAESRGAEGGAPGNLANYVRQLRGHPRLARLLTRAYAPQSVLRQTHLTRLTNTTGNASDLMVLNMLLGGESLAHSGTALQSGNIGRAATFLQRNLSATSRQTRNTLLQRNLDATSRQARNQGQMQGGGLFGFVNNLNAVARQTRNQGPGPTRGNLFGFLTQLNRLTAQHGVALSRATRGIVGQADLTATFNLEPTQELKNLLKPQQAKVHLTPNLWGTGSNPPTERGKPKVTRQHG